MTTHESVVIDGYDLLGETARLDLPDRVVCGRRLNRATAELSAETPHAAHDDVRAASEAAMLPSTITPESPVIDLSHPAHGMFVSSDAGVYMDLYQGVAQKIADEHNPLFEATLDRLREHGLTFRREITTDDHVHLGAAGLDGLHTPQELAALVDGLTAEAFPGKGPFKAFLSNSGAEAGEAALKLAALHAYKRFVRRWGLDVLAALMDDLGIGRDAFFDADASLPDPVYLDYPFFVFGTDGAFHGRTLGVLNLTRSKKAHQLGYPKLRWVRHVPFNGSVDDFTGLLDERPIDAILAAPGGVRAVLEAGKVPVDLVAMFATEAFQGEGGYRLAHKDWLVGLAAACAERDVLLGIDEVQSLGRTGELYVSQHYGIEPDVVWMAKAAVLGITVARAELAADCHLGWHSNTFGSGKLFDVNMSHATFELLARRRDPLFGRTLLENSRIKGLYMRMRLAELSSEHSEVFPEFGGLGGMWGLDVRHREDVIATGWRMGLKLLGCGGSGEVSRIRVVLLADVLTREVDAMIDALDRVFTAVEEQHDL